MKIKYFAKIFAFIITFGAPWLVRAQGVWTKDTLTGFVARSKFSSSETTGRIYVIGGGFGNDSLQYFDPVNHAWFTPVATGHFGQRDSHTASLVEDKIFVVGGSGQYDYAGDSLSIFRPSLNMWSTDLTQGTLTWRLFPTSGIVDGRIFVLGGEGNIGGHDTVLNTLEVLDPTTNAWSTPVTTGRFTPRYGLTASVVNGKIYVFGGDGADFRPTNILEVFDPSSNSWSTPVTTGTFTARAYLTSSVVNNKIYVIGGDLGGTVTPSNLLEIFDPATNTWSKGPPMPTKRFWHASSVVNGKIYVLGGYTPHQELNTVEVFTPDASGVESPPTQSSSMQLSIFPNPLSSRSSISVSNPRIQVVEVKIVDVLGKERSLVFHGPAGPGTHTYEWDASAVSDGVYYCIVKSESGIKEIPSIVRH